MDGKELGLLTEAFLNVVVERIAESVVDKLRGGQIVGYVEQGSSPLGRRRHIEAIRTGALPGVTIGRRYLAKQEDVDRYIAQRPGIAERSSTASDPVDSLATELGFKRSR